MQKPLYTMDTAFITTVHVFLGFCDWQIRHGAILGLSRVSKTCRNLPMKDGLSEVAWSKLSERQVAERDTRVLQAFNLAQVQNNWRVVLAIDSLSCPLKIRRYYCKPAS